MAKKKTASGKGKSPKASKATAEARPKVKKDTVAKATSSKKKSSTKKTAKAKLAKKATQTTKKAAKKSAAAATKKTAAKKTATKKAAAKKAMTKKAAAKKSVAKKATATKAVAKKPASKKAVAKKASQVVAKKKSTKSSKLVKGASPAGSPPPPVEVEPPMPKTRLRPDQLAMFKELLLAKRRELLGDVRTLTKDALGKSRQDSTGDLSSMPIHMADIGSDNWEQDFTLGLIANEQQLVREIDDALQRIVDRTYGVCVVTHRPISIARLKAKPWAKYCIEYAREREVGRY